jgi:hypothetical protein
MSRHVTRESHSPGHGLYSVTKNEEKMPLSFIKIKARSPTTEKNVLFLDDLLLNLSRTLARVIVYIV